MRLTRILLALPVLLVARPMLAQAACPVDVYQPSPLAQAGITIGRVLPIAETEPAQKLLKDAMRFLNDEKKIASNPVGAGYIKAQIYILWLHQPNQADVMTNDQLGARGEKTARVDLIAAADSLLKVVEKTDPACVTETMQWRSAKPWTDRINKAYTFLGSEALDSAEYYAKRSQTLHPTSAYVHNIFAQIANKRGDAPGTLAHLRLAIAESVKDTSIAETTQQMQFQLAQTAQTWAMTGGTADKVALQKEALDLFIPLLRASASKAEGAYALSAASEIIMMNQDTAAARAVLAPMVEDASPYTDLTLLLGADLARSFTMNAASMAMYEGALKKNPNIRDANYFLAYMYYEAKQPQKMIPLTDKLMEIDPSNGDNFLMRAYAYQLMGTAETDRAKKAEFQKLQDEFAAKENALAALHKLQVNRFERREAGAVLGGQIENLTKAAKSYTLKMDFLDAAGNVVETLTTEVANVKPTERGTFEFTATKPGIVAYKYEALK